MVGQARRDFRNQNIGIATYAQTDFGSEMKRSEWNSMKPTLMAELITVMRHLIWRRKAKNV